MTAHPRRLIEVDLPIKRISEHARREKSIRQGHIATLHIWWARRPLAACRAVLCAALWIDPADPNCPLLFRETARDQMLKFANKLIMDRDLHRTSSQYTFGQMNALSRLDPPLDLNNQHHLLALRTALLNFIADFANWDNFNNSVYLETSQALTQAAHEALGGIPGTHPLVVDSFAGGGAIPLEALRVGADAFASDLNPVAVLLNKVLVEYIPRYGHQLAEEIRKWGDWIKDEAQKDLKGYYESDQDATDPIAYLWARTIICEGPGCGYEVPLMRSFWLAKKGDKSIALKLIPNSQHKRVDFEIIHNAKGKAFEGSTVRRGAATCPRCGYTTPVERVRSQLKVRRGGAADARLVAIRCADKETGERTYRLATARDEAAAQKAAQELEQRKSLHSDALSLTPNEPTPKGGGSGAGRAFSQRNYGMDNFEDLFTPRQLLALTTFARLVRDASRQFSKEYDSGLALAVHTCLGMILNRLADFNSSLCVLNSTGGRGVVHTFGRQAIPVVWDFMETNPFNEVGANWFAGIEAFESTIQNELMTQNRGNAEQSSATAHLLSDDSAQVFFTDPPYYDAVPYSDLSDFFVVWFKRTLGDKYPDLFSDELAPKDDECIVDEIKGKDKTFFEICMREAMKEGRRILEPSGIGVVVFAHKSTAGWEAQLQAMVDAGWIITGSWSIDTERPGRLRANDSAALASSVHLICRPRENVSGLLTSNVGEWRDILGELPKRIHEWLPRLAREGVVGADAIFACIGPAMEIFTRYERVEKASGEQVMLRDYLEQVWAAISREALATILEGADPTGFEEDARLTVIWFWSLKTVNNGNGNQEQLLAEEDDIEEDDLKEKSTSKLPVSGYAMEYDTARKIAQGLGADLNLLSRPGGIVTVKGKLATLNSIASRENHLIGIQLSLFGDEATFPRGKTRRNQNPTVSMQDVALRQEALFDLQPEPPVNPDQPQLPMFGKHFEDKRSLIEQLLDGGETVLDRLHQAMLIHGRGQTALLGTFLTETGMGGDARFWRLADALLRLYPKQSEEYRWLDGVLARKKGLGF
jgi:putative DNA methylase